MEKSIETFSTIKTTFYVSGLKRNGLLHSSSENQFKTIESARKWINSDEGHTYARNHTITSYRISRVIELYDDAIENHIVPAEALIQ